jgi:hypothetical protein
MKVPIQTKGDFNKGNLNIEINSDCVLLIQLRELQQGSPDFQNKLYWEITTAMEQAYRHGFIDAKTNALKAVNAV